MSKGIVESSKSRVPESQQPASTPHRSCLSRELSGPSSTLAYRTWQARLYTFHVYMSPRLAVLQDCIKAPFSKLPQATPCWTRRLTSGIPSSGWTTYK